MAVFYIANDVNTRIHDFIKSELDTLTHKNITPTLATVRIGENSSDISYERAATNRLQKLGLGTRNIAMPIESAQNDVISVLKELSRDPLIHGILLFQPLPPRLNDFEVKSAIAPEKDVDCATPQNLAAVMAGWRDCYPYCAPAAVMELLDHYKIELSGKEAVIVGRGLVVGRPLAMMLVSRRATVCMCNSKTKELAAHTRRAELLISAAGVPGLITKDYVSPGQIVIDVGTTYVDGKLCGDVDVASVEPVVAAVTPTPGGISGITTSVLAKHVVLAAKRISQVKTGGAKS